MIAILGDGLLGNEIGRQTGWPIFSRRNGSLNILEPKTFERFAEYQTVVNCIAHTQTYSTERQPHWETNVAFVDRLIDFTNSNQQKLVHISTDYVYAGSVEFATEDDLPIPVPTWYGYTKLMGDTLVQLRSKNYLLCRLSHKPTPFPYDNGWTNVRTCGDYVDVIAGLVIKLIEMNSAGLINVGTEPKTIYELSKKTRETVESIAPPLVPIDTTVNTDKLKKMFMNIK